MLIILITSDPTHTHTHHDHFLSHLVSLTSISDSVDQKQDVLVHVSNWP